MGDFKRGEIWWIRLDPSIGVEAATLDTSFKSVKPPNGVSRKTRACLVLQNDFGNKASKITTIVPFLAKRSYSFVVNVKPSSKNGLDKERGLHLNQIRSIDCSRIESKLGMLEEIYWEQIKIAVDVQLGFY